MLNLFNVFRRERTSPLSRVARDTRIETRLTHPILEQVIRLARRTSAMPGVPAATQMTHGLDSDLELRHEKNPRFTPTPLCLGLLVLPGFEPVFLTIIYLVASVFATHPQMMCNRSEFTLETNNF